MRAAQSIPSEERGKYVPDAHREKDSISSRQPSLFREAMFHQWDREDNYEERGGQGESAVKNPIFTHGTAKAGRGSGGTKDRAAFDAQNEKIGDKWSKSQKCKCVHPQYRTVRIEIPLILKYHGDCGQSNWQLIKHIKCNGNLSGSRDMSASSHDREYSC